MSTLNSSFVFECLAQYRSFWSLRASMWNRMIRCITLSLTQENSESFDSYSTSKASAEGEGGVIRFSLSLCWSMIQPGDVVKTNLQHRMITDFSWNFPTSVLIEDQTKRSPSPYRHVFFPSCRSLPRIMLSHRSIDHWLPDETMRKKSTDIDSSVLSVKRRVGGRNAGDHIHNFIGWKEGLTKLSQFVSLFVRNRVRRTLSTERPTVRSLDAPGVTRREEHEQKALTPRKPVSRPEASGNRTREKSGVLETE